ncbi:MAG: CoA transferase [Burkholderiales bacterium]|nr:CoA transferase [Burkholderiales bacterium]
MNEPLPFAGLVVLDISTYIAGPLAATLLADFGADVVKVEDPQGGDPNRVAGGFSSYPQSPVNYPWQMDARNKRSLALDLKHPQAHDVLARLVARADVLITNFPMPVRARLRLRHEDLQPLNERLVYASLTGYGESGPDRDQPGFDTAAYFARAGWFDAQRHEGQPPHFALPSSGDRATATALFAAILMALYRRERSGRGGMVGASLVAAGLWSNAITAQGALLGAFLPPRPPRERPRSALVNIYRTADDRWFQLVLAVEDPAWPGLCRAIGQPALATDPRFATTPERRRHAADLTAILDAAFGARDWTYWQAQFKTHQIIHGAIARMQDIPHDPQLRAAGAVVATDNPDLPLSIGPPLTADFAQPVRARPAPALGEHTDAVLAESGYTAADIAALRAAGVVA